MVWKQPILAATGYQELDDFHKVCGILLNCCKCLLQSNAVPQAQLLIIISYQERRKINSSHPSTSS
jgi:hypothetical protein